MIAVLSMVEGGNMQPGQILVAGIRYFVIRMLGDVRLTLSVSFDHFIDDMFGRDNFDSIVFDLTAAEAVDSTTLGLMAKISMLATGRGLRQPLIISTSPGINRILESMGFSEIFDIVENFQLPEQLEAAPLAARDDCDQTKARVLDAHRILMGMNQKNAETFQDLVKTLEDE